MFLITWKRIIFHDFFFVFLTGGFMTNIRVHGFLHTVDHGSWTLVLFSSKNLRCCSELCAAGHINHETRARAPRWHTPGGCHLHRVLLESYTFHRWIEVEMKTFLASKSTAKTHLEKYFVYLFCGYFQRFLFCFGECDAPSQAWKSVFSKNFYLIFWNWTIISLKAWIYLCFFWTFGNQIKIEFKLSKSFFSWSESSYFLAIKCQ